MLSTVLLAAYGVAMLALFVVAVTTLAWMLDSWRTPEAVGQMPFPVPDEPQLSFSLIVPARHEEAVLADTVARLLEPGPPRLRGRLVVGDDDPGTAAVAHGLAARDTPRARRRRRQRAEEQAEGAEHRRCRTAPARWSGSSTPRTRSRPSCSSTSTRCFRQTGAHVVQGGVQLDELPLQLVVAAQRAWSTSSGSPAGCTSTRASGFIPLGGNTVFVRTDLLRQVGGWDPDCLAEDCELGVRLSSRGGAGRASPYSPDARDPRGDPADPEGPAQAAHPVEPGLPAGAAARASGAGCRPAASG